MKNFLDETTKELSIQWDQKQPEIVAQVQEFEKALAFTRNIFGDAHYLRKWNGQNFEPRKNRAVFDIMLQYFSEPEVRLGLEAKSPAIVDQFKNLCANDRDFLDAIETTTKSISANRKRFNSWKDVVSSLSGVDLTHLAFPD